MASLRLAGASLVTSRPSIEILPPLVSSSPAINLSRVDLPQPEGPTKTTNSPSSISKLMFGMMFVAPKDLVTLLSVIWPIFSSRYSCRRSLHRTEGQAAHQLSLAEPAHDQDRRDGERRGRRQLRPEQALRAG